MRFIILIMSLLLFGCKTTETQKSSISEVEADVVMHAHSEMVFPEVVGKFLRGELHEYDEYGKNVSIPYNLIRLGPTVTATVYIHPGVVDVKVFPIPKVGTAPDWFVEEYFDECKAQVSKYNKGATIISEGEPLVEPTGLKRGRQAVFSYLGSTPYGKQPFLSELHVYAYKSWLIKYRFTYLADYKDVVRDDIDNFMRELSWPR